MLYLTLSNTFSVLFWNISYSSEHLFCPFHGERDRAREKRERERERERERKRCREREREELRDQI